MTKDEAMQQAIEALPLAIFPFKSEPMLYRSDVLAALAQPEFLSSNEADIAQLIEERDVREDILDKVLDMVLGIDRPEWSSSYQYIDAVEDVRAALAQQDAEAHLQATQYIEAKLKEKNT